MRVARVVLAELVPVLERHLTRAEAAPKPRIKRGPKRKRTEPRQYLLRALDAALSPRGIHIVASRDGPLARTYLAILSAAGVEIADPLNDIRRYLRMV
jgi:hypothetical protein